MEIKRKIVAELKALAKQFPVVSIYGPRQTDSKDNFLIYGGNENQKRKAACVLGWQSLEKVFK